MDGEQPNSKSSDGIPLTPLKLTSSQSSFDARYNPDHFATHHLTLDEKSFDPAVAAAAVVVGDEPEEVARRHEEVAVVGHN